MSFLEFSKTGIKTRSATEQGGGAFDIEIVGGNSNIGVQRSVKINDTQRVDTSLIGLGLVKFDDQFNRTFDGVFDTRTSNSNRNSLANHLTSLGPNEIAVVASGGSFQSNATLDDAFKQLGSKAWPNSTLLNRIPTLSYAALIHGTHGLVIEQLMGSGVNDPAAVIRVGYDTINQIGSNGFGKQLITFEDEVSLIEAEEHTLLPPTSLDELNIKIGGHLKAVGFGRVDEDTFTADGYIGIEIEFLNSEMNIVSSSIGSTKSAYNWNYFTCNAQIPDCDFVTVRAVKAGVGTGQIKNVVMTRHNGNFLDGESTIGKSGIASDSIYESLGVYGVRNSSDWEAAVDTSTNVHNGISISQDTIESVVWMNKSFNDNLKRAVTKTVSEITLESEDFVNVDNNRVYFGAVWVRKELKDSGSVKLGVTAFDAAGQPVTTSDSDLVMDSTHYVEIPTENLSEQFQIVSFILVPRTWSQSDIDDFVENTQDYYGQVGTGVAVGNYTNNKVIAMNADVESVKLQFVDEGNITESDIKWVLPILRRVPVLSHDSKRLQTISLTIN